MLISWTLNRTKIGVCISPRNSSAILPSMIKLCRHAFRKENISSRVQREVSVQQLQYQPWVSAGLKRDGKVKPRAYDFRHHFACANIMRWSQEGKDVHAMLPYLMRYMGHSSLESTYYYIHLIPDYFSQYTKLTSSSEDLIPEVEAYEV